MSMILAIFILYFTSLTSAAKDNISDSTDDNQNPKDVPEIAVPCSTESYTFMVSITPLEDFLPVGKTCAGTLLDARHVLTAGSCLSSKHTLMVIAGLSDPENVPEIRYVSDRIPHLHYSSEIKHDMAILVLEDPIYPSDHISYVVLPSKAHNKSEIEKLCEKGISLSWGHTVYDGQVDELPDVSSLECTPLSFVPPQDCESMSRSIKVHEGHVCTLAIECQGDQGGPILCNGQQFAVISWKTGCSNHLSSVHTRVDKNLEFIRLFVQPTRIRTRRSMGVSLLAMSITKWFILIVAVNLIVLD